MTMEKKQHQPGMPGMPVKETTGEEAIAEISEQAPALENTGAEQHAEEKTDEGEAGSGAGQQQQTEENAGAELKAEETATITEDANTNATEEIPAGPGLGTEGPDTELPKQEE